MKGRQKQKEKEGEETARRRRGKCQTGRRAGGLADRRKSPEQEGRGVSQRTTFGVIFIKDRIEREKRWRREERGEERRLKGHGVFWT